VKVITDYDYIYSVTDYDYIASGNGDCEYLRISSWEGVIDYDYLMPEEEVMWLIGVFMKTVPVKATILLIY